MASITSLPSGVSGSSLVLISEQTASSSATISFTSGIDSTYKEYIFKFIDLHPQTDQAQFSFQVDTGTNTNYNQTITSTFYRAYHLEDGSQSGLGYVTGDDQAQGTGFQVLSHSGTVGNANDENLTGYLHLFNPSSSTFVKHFVSRTSANHEGNYEIDSFCAGYVNTTTALTRVRFKFASGNIDAGTIKMYGVV
jgi:hypothetical protein